MMNEINKLDLADFAAGIGVMNKAAYTQTANIAKQLRRDQEGAVGRATAPTSRTKAVASLKAAGDRRQRQELEAGGREAHGRRQVTTRSVLERGGRSQAGPALECRATTEGRRAMSVLIKGGRVITAADDYVADIFIEGERISLIGESLDRAGRQGDRRDAASTCCPGASTRTRISRCRGAARRRSTTSSRATQPPRSAARPRTSTSASRARARPSATRSQPGTRSARASR